MDFHSLPRRELQALCMSNGIKANMTNIAMADALKSLQKVEGIGETPIRKAEPKSELPKAGRRAASSRQVGSARPHEPQGSPLPRSRRVTARLGGSEILNFSAADAEEGKNKEKLPETPRAPTTRRRAQGKKEDVVESTIPKTTTTRRRAATKKEEEKTVGITTRRRTTRQTSKIEDLDVDIGKSALKMADLENDVEDDVSIEQLIEKDVVEEVDSQSVEEQSGSKEEKEEKDIEQVLPIEQSKEEGEEKDVVGEVNDQSVGEGSGSKDEKEEEDIEQVLPIEQSKEEGEHKDVVENVLSNDPSMEEEETTIRVQEKEEKEITQVLPIEQPEEGEICHEEEEEQIILMQKDEKDTMDTISNEQISSLEEEIDSRKEEDHAEEKEQDDAISATTENLDNSEIYQNQEQLDSFNELMMQVPEAKKDSEEDMEDDAISATTEERGVASSDENLDNSETYHKQEQLDSSNELMQVPEAEEDTEEDIDDDDAISVTTEESPIKGLVSPLKQQQNIAKEAKEEEGRKEGNNILLSLQQLSLSKSEVEGANTEVPETVGNSTADFSAGKAAYSSRDFDMDIPVEIDDFGNEDAFLSSLVTGEIPVETTEKFDLFPLSVSDNNKENPTGGDGRQKKIEPQTMSLRKLKDQYKKSLINRKAEEKRSALKPLEENLLTNSMEDAVM